MLLGKRYAVLARAGLAGFVSLAGTTACYVALAGVVCSVRPAVGVPSRRYSIDAVACLESLALLICFGVLAAVAVASLRIMRASLGVAGLLAASAGSVAAALLCLNDSWPLSHMLVNAGLGWRIGLLWCVAAGGVAGAAIAGERRGARSLWVPTLGLIATVTGLWTLLMPAEQALTVLAR